MKTLAIGLLALALGWMVGTASADCGWVLWGGTYRIPDSYGAEAAFESKRDCVAYLEKKVNRLALLHPDRARGSISEYWACWPVGVDPTRVMNPEGAGQQGNQVKP